MSQIYSSKAKENSNSLSKPKLVTCQSSSLARELELDAKTKTRLPNVQQMGKGINTSGSIRLCKEILGGKGKQRSRGGILSRRLGTMMEEGHPELYDRKKNNRERRVGWRERRREGVKRNGGRKKFHVVQDNGPLLG